MHTKLQIDHITRQSYGLSVEEVDETSSEYNPLNLIEKLGKANFHNHQSVPLVDENSKYVSLSLSFCCRG